MPRSLMVGFFIVGMFAAPFLVGEGIADSAAVLASLTKNDVRIELQAGSLPFRVGKGSDAL